MSKNERQSNVSWRDAQIECAKCGEAGAVLDRVIQDSERVRLEFGCPFCGTLSVMEFVDVFHFGQIIDQIPLNGLSKLCLTTLSSHHSNFHSVELFRPLQYKYLNLGHDLHLARSMSS